MENLFLQQEQNNMETATIAFHNVFKYKKFLLNDLAKGLQKVMGNLSTKSNCHLYFFIIERYFNG